MEKYTKSNKEYLDDYDRATIKMLKEIESKGPINFEIPEGLRDKLHTPKFTISPFSRFYTVAVERYQDRSLAIMDRKMVDQRKDALLDHTPVPNNVACKTCGQKMYYDGHMFKENDTLLLFVFSCPQGHVPRRVMYKDGHREWHFKKSKCDKCGGELQTEKEEGKESIIFKDTCELCGNIAILELRYPEPEAPIDENEREKYCNSWQHHLTLEQTFEKACMLVDSYEESQGMKEAKERWNIERVERVNVPQLEERLIDLTAKNGYSKFKFDKHSHERYLTIDFSLQDPSNRQEKESVKEITLALKESLLTTNWRLTSQKIDYRLGLLTGKLRAYVDVSKN